MSGPDAAKWSVAIQKELNNLGRRETFRYTRILPPGHKALHGMWVFTIKADGTYKVHLVVKGCVQPLGHDYSETFSPVARSASLRLLAALAALHGLVIYAADFTVAFLNGRLEEEIYMDPPDGYKDPSGGSGGYLRLVRSLYRLKQAGRVWYQCLDKALRSLGFSGLNSDECVYTRMHLASGTIITAVHVDDMTGAAKDDGTWDEFCRELGEHYELKNLGGAKDILGLEIEQDCSAGTVHITQTRYIETLARNHGVYEAPPLSLPLPPGAKFSTSNCPTAGSPQQAAMKDIPYLELVGALLFLTCQTRPDLAHAVCLLSRFSSNPAIEHWEALLGALIYARHTSSVGLLYSRSGSPSPSVYSDADWGMCPDTQRSTTGWIVMLAGGLISWSSKRQSVVAQSTMEAKFVAMSMACREAYWVRSWLTEVDGLCKRPPPTPVFCDNLAAITISKDPASHRMTKHIVVCFHHVRDQVAEREFLVYHIPSRDQVADCHALVKSYKSERGRSP